MKILKNQASVVNKESAEISGSLLLLFSYVERTKYKNSQRNRQLNAYI